MTPEAHDPATGLETYIRSEFHPAPTLTPARLTDRAMLAIYAGIFAGAGAVALVLFWWALLRLLAWGLVVLGFVFVVVDSMAIVGWIYSLRPSLFLSTYKGYESKYIEWEDVDEYGRIIESVSHEAQQEYLAEMARRKALEKGAELEIEK